MFVRVVRVLHGDQPIRGAPALLRVDVQRRILAPHIARFRQWAGEADERLGRASGVGIATSRSTVFPNKPNSNRYRFRVGTLPLSLRWFVSVPPLRVFVGKDDTVVIHNFEEA
jgi:hypothetical protein